MNNFLLQSKRHCDVCGRISPKRLWSNSRLLGSKDKLCEVCFRGWYSEQITNREELAAYSKGQND